MNKILPFLAILTFAGCKDDLVKKPERLIEKSQMVNIMYDLSLLEAIKYQNPSVLDSNQISPKQFIYKKYKVDSLQLAQNNVFYASDYKTYKIMFDEVVNRLERDKKKLELQLKAEEKKNKILAKKLLEKKTNSLKISDSIKVMLQKR
jgi:hypothetical protein